jgi:hypothetical protein
MYAAKPNAGPEPPPIVLGFSGFDALNGKIPTEFTVEVPN